MTVPLGNTGKASVHSNRNAFKRIDELLSLITTASDEDKPKYQAEYDFLTSTKGVEGKKTETALDGITDFIRDTFTEKDAHGRDTVKYERFIIKGADGYPLFDIINDPAESRIDVVDQNSFKQTNEKEPDSSVTVSIKNKCNEIEVSFSKGSQNIGIGFIDNQKNTQVYGFVYSDGELTGVINPELMNERLVKNTDFIITTKDGNQLKYNKEQGRFLDKYGEVFEGIKAVDSTGKVITEEKGETLAPAGWPPELMQAAKGIGSEMRELGAGAVSDPLEVSSQSIKYSEEELLSRMNISKAAGLQKR